MKPVKTKDTNGILRGNDDNVTDLPVANIKFADGTVAVESCWELSPEDIAEIQKSGRIYFLCLGPTHPPIWLSPYSALTGKMEGQTDTAQ